MRHRKGDIQLKYDKRTHYMAVSFATYGDRGRFVDNHNVLVDMNEGDRLAGDRYFVPATIHTSGFRLLGDGLGAKPHGIML